MSTQMLGRRKEKSRHLGHPKNPKQKTGEKLFKALTPKYSSAYLFALLICKALVFFFSVNLVLFIIVVIQRMGI